MLGIIRNMQALKELKKGPSGNKCWKIILILLVASVYVVLNMSPHLFNRKLSYTTYWSSSKPKY